jgi:ATP-dependent exoDNAse (exonuclease V) beta subunit
MAPKDKPLKILNASAGSGKTYHLVKEYIKLLIKTEDKIRSFTNVIAMTFTNKAALEMKERIITALDQLGSPDFFDNQSKDLSDKLSMELQLDSSLVQIRCKRALQLILHQYEDFHIMTMDKFNLRLIKSFGRDLDIQGDFEVILDERELIEKIVDDILNRLGMEGSEELNELVFSYAKTNIDEGSQWNFRRNLVAFGAILKKEKNNLIVDKLLSMEFSLLKFKSLRAEQVKIDGLFAKQSEQLLKVLDLEQLEQDQLPGKSRTMNAINKLAAYTSFPITDSLTSDSFMNYLDEGLKPGQIYPNSVKREIIALMGIWENKISEYAARELFMKNFFNMALLQLMAAALKKARKDDQLIRISEFNTLISDLLQDESAPFIYERLGTKFKHFLLDEFQDTSHLQWLNLIPLIHESLGQNHMNLIVGDPKQSIYRFKNGVAEQFVVLPEIYNPNDIASIDTKSNFFRQMGEVSQLDNNWRSSASIVKFNNTFFPLIKELLPDTTAAFYKLVTHNAKSKLNGRIQIISKEEKLQSENLVPQIINWITECKEAGFMLGEICILGATNKECNTWALGLNDAGYKVVSADSLLINSSLKVQLTIAYLERRLNPSGENEKKRFAELYFRLRSEFYSKYKSYIEEKESKNGRKYRLFNDDLFLEDHFSGANNFFFKHENIYDLIQQFYRIVGYDELTDPYLHHLADIAFDYGLTRGPDLKMFLSNYEEKKDKIAVQIPESDQAIRLMTIHKSKGLEFPVVIVPSMNFRSGVTSEFLIDLDDEFVVYKTPTVKDHLSVLQDLYYSERDQIVTDNINKCYVAMTRAIERLYIGNYYEKKKFGELFHKAIGSHEATVEKDGTRTIDINDGTRNAAKSKTKKIELFHPENIRDCLWFPDIALQDREEIVSNNYLSEEMQFGNQFHLLVSLVDHSSEIETTIDKLIQKGEISAVNKATLKEKLGQLYSQSDYQKLLDGKIDVLNEQSIIVDETTIIRPDKIILKENETIVVDYKTGIPSQKDEKQILDYKSTLEKMGYPKPSCYLFYTSINELRLVA